jgi:hypothetical protein
MRIQARNVSPGARPTRPTSPRAALAQRRVPEHVVDVAHRLDRDGRARRVGEHHHVPQRRRHAHRQHVVDQLGLAVPAVEAVVDVDVVARLVEAAVGRAHGGQLVVAHLPAASVATRRRAPGRLTKNGCQPRPAGASCGPGWSGPGRDAGRRVRRGASARSGRRTARRRRPHGRAPAPPRRRRAAARSRRAASRCRGWRAARAVVGRQRPGAPLPGQLGAADPVGAGHQRVTAGQARRRQVVGRRPQHGRVAHSQRPQAGAQGRFHDARQGARGQRQGGGGGKGHAVESSYNFSGQLTGGCAPPVSEYSGLPVETAGLSPR